MGSIMRHGERRCSANTIVVVAGPWAVTWMQRELSYRCKNGRAMGNSTGYNSAEDDGQQT